MSQHFIGLDLGTFSVKAVVLKQGLKGGEVVQALSEPVNIDENGNALTSEVVAAADRVIKRIDIPDAPVFCALPGEFVSVYKIKLPISASRRAREVLLFELDELLPYSSDDAVFDYIEQDRDSSDITYTVACVRRDRFKIWLEALQQTGIDPAEVSCAPLSYDAFFRDKFENDDPVAVIDIGHTRTNVVITKDKVSTSRTILRGGRMLTATLAEAASSDFEKAEKFKIQEGLSGKIGEVLTPVADIFITEIMQTLNAHLASGGSSVNRVVLCGGTSKLKGLQDLIESRLNIEVVLYDFDEQTSSLSEEIQVLKEDAVLATCLGGLSSVPKSLRFNFRKGEFAFKGDTEAVQKKLLLLAACFVMIIGAWIFSTFARYIVSGQQADVVKAQLENETLKVFGKKIVNRSIIEKKLMPKSERKTPVPFKDAYDVLIELSSRIPSRVVHDIDQLQIKPGHVKLIGRVNSELKEAEPGDAPIDEDLSPTDLIKSELAKFDECFTSFRIPRVRTVNDRQQYTMEIDSKCP